VLKIESLRAAAADFTAAALVGEDWESAIESLLMSTVNKISHPILNQMRRFYETSEPEAVELPKDPFGLEE